MEIETVISVLQRLPDGTEIELVSDCELLHSLKHYGKFSFKNKYGLRSPGLGKLAEYDQLVKEKKLKVSLWHKTYHEWHTKCHKGCLQFRDYLKRRGTCWEVYSLDPNYKAQLISRHLSRKNAATAAYAYALHCKEYAIPLFRTVLALDSIPQDKVKDEDGHIWSIKK